MTVREELEKLISLEEISKYLNEKEKKFIIKIFKKKEKIFEKEYQFENDKYKIAVVVFYNLLTGKEDLKNRKIRDSSKLAFSWENLSKISKVSEKTLHNKNKVFVSKFGDFIKDISIIDNIQEDDMSNKVIENLLKNIKKCRRKIDSQEASNKFIMNIFITTFESVKALYPDKDAIKIKEYLVHIQANMIIAGYNVNDKKIEQIFCEFSKYLGFELTDGRNEENFVKVKDAYGKYDNKVYIEFRR